MYNYYSDNSNDYNGYMPCNQYYNPFIQGSYRFINPMAFYPPFPFVPANNPRSSRTADVDISEQISTDMPIKEDLNNLNQEDISQSVMEKKDDKIRVNNLYSMNQNMLNLNNQMRKIWLEHVFYIKFALMSIIYNLDNKTIAFKNLTQNVMDIQNVFSRYYNPDIAERFANLFKNHILITLDIFNAIKKNDTKTLANLEKELRTNSQEISNFLASINPNFDRNKIDDMLNNHNIDIKNFAVLTKDKKYEQANDVFNKMKTQALIMADMLTNGIILAFPDKF